MNVRRIVSRLGGVAILAGLIGWAMLTKGAVATFLDTAALMIMFGIVVGGLWISFDPKLVFQSFARGICCERVADPARLTLHLAVFNRAHQLAWSGGLFGTVFGAILMLKNMDDPDKIGPAMALCLLSLFYGIILAEFIIGPLKSGMIEQSITTVAQSGVAQDSEHKKTRGFAVAGAGSVLFTMLLILVSIAFASPPNATRTTAAQPVSPPPSFPEITSASTLVIQQP